MGPLPEAREGVRDQGWIVVEVEGRQMNVIEFVEKLKAKLTLKEFAGVCQKAKDGKMGFGDFPNDWGTRDGRG